MKTRRPTWDEAIYTVDSIVRGLDPDAGPPEVIPCTHQLIMWYQDGRGRRIVVDFGRNETFVERIDGGGQCVSCVQVQPGGVTRDGRRLDLWSLVREGYEWMRAPL